RHDDDAGRPEIRASKQRWRPDKNIAAKIKRKDDTWIVFQACNQRRIALRLTAEHEAAGRRIEEALGNGGLRDAVVDPEFERGMRVPQPRQNRIAVAGPFDRVEIRHIERPEWKDRQQP